MENTKCLIIGSGPAGYTAAIYASRADLKPIVYQGMEPGGQLTTTTEVDNFPGYPEGIDGPAMMEQFQKQAERFGADIRWGVATEIDTTDCENPLIRWHIPTVFCFGGRHLRRVRNPRLPVERVNVVQFFEVALRPVGKCRTGESTQ